MARVLIIDPFFSDPNDDYGLAVENCCPGKRAQITSFSTTEAAGGRVGASRFDLVVVRPKASRFVGCDATIDDERFLVPFLIEGMPIISVYGKIPGSGGITAGLRHEAEACANKCGKSGYALTISQMARFEIGGVIADRIESLTRRRMIFATDYAKQCSRNRLSC